MENSISVVMYHYVRPLERTRYPKIKGLDSEGFRRQIDFLKERFNIISMAELIAVLDGNQEIASPTALLTFDDGFVDHMNYVLPVLHEAGLEGSFFPPALPVLDCELLDVHRIHFILACNDDPSAILDRLLGLMNEHLDGKHEEALLAETLRGRYDSAEVVTIKRLLQRDLPRKVRRSVSAQLFSDFVSVDERSFVEELYMSEEQLRFMASCGMHIGSHAYTHEWLGTLDREEQKRELTRSIEMLARIKPQADEGWTLAYPYGDFNPDTLEIAASLGCRAAFTTQVGLAQAQDANRLTLERFDTNDFPQ
jgi:peptidoglycan/xylan/chitin deacetylase (PgdA/CDA1 family)